MQGHFLVRSRSFFFSSEKVAGHKESLGFRVHVGPRPREPFFWHTPRERAADWANLVGLSRAGTSLALILWAQH